MRDGLLTSPDLAASSADALARLQTLAAELTCLGWTATVKAPRNRRPRLYARNPEPGASALSENIYAQPRADGTWAYWWPWAEQIADTAAQAARIIVRVLRPADT